MGVTFSVWYKNKSTRISILLAVSVITVVCIFVASLEIRMNAPVLIMTAHNYSNIIVFNANTGAFITTQLLDISYQKHLDLPTYAKQGKLQFRSMISRDGEITVANGHRTNPFIATFSCNHVPGWKLNKYFANNSQFIQHPYGLTWDSKRKWWLFTTQDTSSLFIYNENGKPITNLNGMKQHYPGAVFTLINQTNGLYLDTFINNIHSFNKESKYQQNLDLKQEKSTLRGVAIDIQYGLIFVAVEIFGKILVFDIEQDFNNTYNITFGDNNNHNIQPISVLNGEPYFPFTLFITEKINNNGIYAVRYSKTGYSIWWQAQKSPYLKHATGIALSADSLFVLSQGQHSILRYSPYSGHYLGKVVHFTNHDPSHIISHKGIGKVGNPIETRITLGEQILYIPSGKTCAVM